MTSHVWCHAAAVVIRMQVISIFLRDGQEVILVDGFQGQELSHVKDRACKQVWIVSYDIQNVILSVWLAASR